MQRDELAERRQLLQTIGAMSKERVLQAVVDDPRDALKPVSVRLRLPFERSTRRLVLDAARLLES